jgi:hypothetical protein
MQTYELLIYDRAIKALSDDTTLVRTSRGVDEIKLYFDSPEWLEGFDLSVAFKNGETLEELPLDLTEIVGGDYLAQATCEVPDSVLLEAGRLGVTVHGVSAGGDHIITERAFPLVVELEGDEEGEIIYPEKLLMRVEQYYPTGDVERSYDDVGGLYEIKYYEANSDENTRFIFNTHGKSVLIENMSEKAQNWSNYPTIAVYSASLRQDDGSSTSDYRLVKRIGTVNRGSSATIAPMDDAPYINFTLNYKENGKYVRFKITTID